MLAWLPVIAFGCMLMGWSGGKSRLGLGLIIIGAVFVLKPAFGH